jgi:hypothetical protein
MAAPSEFLSELGEKVIEHRGDESVHRKKQNGL